MFDPSTYHTRRRILIEQEVPDTGLVLLLGNQQSPRNYAANPHPFRQDSSFLYYFGLERPDLYGLIDLDSGTSTLYGEERTFEDTIWMGEAPPLQEAAAAAGIDAVASVADLEEALATARNQDRSIHVLPPYRNEHRLRYASLLGLPHDQVEDAVSEPLIRAVVRQRSVKTEAEVAQIEEALDRTAALHEYALRRAAPGVAEREIWAGMTGLVASQNSTFSFTPTCSIHGEVLHNHSYPNTMSEGDLLVVDAGAESSLHYAGDVTRTMPVGGTFSTRQKALYEAVLAAQEAAIQALAPGVPFLDVHLLAARTLTERLVEIGLMQGDPEAAVDAGAHALFFSHGLGHMMGLDVHDMESLGEDYVGYAEDQTRSEQFGLHTLRLARPVQPGFVVSVEPGCYFIPPLIDRWQAEGRHEAFINYDRVDDFRDVGGIRIEDDVLITEDGVRGLGPSIPKAVDEVENQVGTAAGA